MNSLSQLIASITAEQANAFKQASGTGISYQELKKTIVLIFVILLLLWWAWLILSQYRLFIASKASLTELGNNILRASVLVAFLVYFSTNFS